jgi:hypothetical protein
MQRTGWIMADSTNLQEQVTAHTVVRVLQPALAEQLQSRLHKEPLLSEYIIYQDKQIYLSLQHIQDSRERDQIYQQIMAFQIRREGEGNLRQLPSPFREMLAPQYQQMWNLLKSFAIGGIVGIVVGILAMAVVALGITVGVVTEETGIGLGLSAISFLVFAVLGSLGSSILVWKQLNQSSVDAGVQNQ